MKKLIRQTTAPSSVQYTDENKSHVLYFAKNKSPDKRKSPKPDKNTTDNSNSQTFDIPVKWEMRTVLSVPAKNLKEAFKIVNSHEYDLPEGEYIHDSFEIDYDRLEEQ